MSAGPRISIDQAGAYGMVLLDRWRLSLVEEDMAPESPIDVLPVGSGRRQTPDVGDLEFLAVVPPGWTRDKRCEAHDDPLFQRINATLFNPWTPDAKTPVLFAPPAAGGGGAGGGGGGGGRPFARAVKGVRPGFLEASVEIIGKGGEVVIPVQIFRCERGSWGWNAVMRTGPKELGELLLMEWKRRQGTLGTETQGSIHGWLVDKKGERRPCHSEREFFELVGLAFVEPEARQRLLLTMRPH